MKLKVLFIIPILELKNPKDPFNYLMPLGPLKLEAYCRDIATFNFLFLRNIQLEPLDTNVIAITTSLFNMKKGLETLLKLINEIRKVFPDKKILLGGNLPFFYPQIENLVDWVCYYEGEKPLRRALLNILNNEPLVHSKIHEPLTCEELNNTELLDISHYRDIMPIQFGIGCPSNCIFCSSHRSQGKELRHPSVEKMIFDIDYYANKGIKQFLLVDDYIFSDRDYYLKIFNHIKNLGIKITFLYLNMDLDLEEMDILSQVSIPVILFTPDACNERIFNKIGKVGNFNNLPKMISYFNNKGFSVWIQFLVNFPFETDEDRREAIEYYSNLNIDNVHVLSVKPIPDTPFQRMLLKDKININEFLLKGEILAKEMEQKINKNLGNKR